jgi:hypothetical protein
VTPGRINLPHLYSHTGDDLLGGISEVMETCVVWSFRSATWSFCRSSIWRDMFLGMSLAYADDRGKVVSLEQGCWFGGGRSVVLL